MGLASELVCNPPSPASEVPHGSLCALGLRIAADRSRVAEEEERRGRCESRNTAPRLAEASVQGGRTHPERDGVSGPALPPKTELHCGGTFTVPLFVLAPVGSIEDQ